MIPPSLDVAEEKKATKIRKGVWRNQYRVPPSYGSYRELVQRGRVSFGNIVTCVRKWPSREVAEEKAIRDEYALTRQNAGVRYLGARFFPEGGEQ